VRVDVSDTLTDRPAGVGAHRLTTEVRLRVCGNCGMSVTY
jgi:hypothetical protein